jgi:hypothetical protein
MADEAVIRIRMDGGRRPGPGGASGPAPGAAPPPAGGRFVPPAAPRPIDPIAEAMKVRRRERQREAIKDAYAQLYPKTEEASKTMDLVVNLAKRFSWQFGGVAGALIGAVLDTTIAWRAAHKDMAARLPTIPVVPRVGGAAAPSTSPVGARKWAPLSAIEAAQPLMQPGAPPPDLVQKYWQQALDSAGKAHLDDNAKMRWAERMAEEEHEVGSENWAKFEAARKQRKAAAAARRASVTPPPAKFAGAVGSGAAAPAGGGPAGPGGPIGPAGAGAAATPAGGAGGAAGAAGAVMTTFAESFGSVGLVATAVAVSLGAVAVSGWALARMFNEQAHQYEQFSAPLAQATALADVRQTLGDVRRAQEVGPSLARFVEAQSKLEQTVQDVGADIVRELGPTMVAILENTKELITTFGPAISSLVMLVELSGGIFTLIRQSKDENANNVNLPSPLDVLLERNGVRVP